MFLVDAERQIFQPLSFGGRYAEIGVYLARYSQEILRYGPSATYLIDPYTAPLYEELVPSDTHLANPRELLTETFRMYYPEGIEKAIPNAFETARSKFENNPTVHFLRKTSQDAVKDFADGSLDYMHLDANNRFDFVLANLRRWEAKMAPGGFIVADNCYVSPIGERQFISALEAVSRFIKSSDWCALAISNRWFSNVLLCRKAAKDRNSEKLLSVLLESKVSFFQLPPESIHSARHKYVQHTSPDGTTHTKEYISFAD